MICSTERETDERARRRLCSERWCSRRAAARPTPRAGATGAGGVKTDNGVTDTDDHARDHGRHQRACSRTSVRAINAGNQLWADEVNAAGGICGRQIEIEVVDHGYKADIAKTLYPQLEPKVLGIVQLLGSPVLAALKPNLHRATTCSPRRRRGRVPRCSTTRTS